MIDRLFGWWYIFAAPQAVSDDAPLREREFVRKGRFTSIVLLAEIAYHLFNLVGLVAGDVIQAIIPVVVTLLFFLVALVLNRRGYVRVAAVITLVFVEIGMCIAIVTTGLQPGGFATSNLQMLSILVQPDLIAISLFPVVAALPLGLFNCLFCVAFLFFIPKTVDLQQALAVQGLIIYVTPVSVQLIVLLISWVWVSSTSQEMRRANRAEEVNKLSQALAAQQQNALAEKQQLEESIQQVVSVHMQVANGNFAARVPLNRQNVLWPLAGSLNNLLARLQRWQHDARQQVRTEKAIQQTLQEVQDAKRQGLPVKFQSTGTSLDPLIAELLGDRSFYRSSTRSSLKAMPLPDQEN